MQFFQAFGVDWKSLLAQFVNFAILMFILYRLAYKPLLKFMHDRRDAIARGLTQAKEARASLQHSQEEKERLVTEARKEASAIVEAARLAAENQRAEILAQAKADVAKVVAEGKAALQAERSNMVNAVRKDVIEMVVSSTEKILGGVVDEKVNQSWLKTQLSKIR